MRVSIDPSRCASSGYCARLAPKVFRASDRGPTEVVNATPGKEMADVVGEAVELCPTRAITVAE